MFVRIRRYSSVTEPLGSVMMTGRVPSKASFFGMEPSAEAWTMPRTSEASSTLVRNRSFNRAAMIPTIRPRTTPAAMHSFLFGALGS